MTKHLSNYQSPSWYIWLQVILFFIIFVIGADTFLISPLIPFISRSWNIPIGSTGLLVTAYALAYALFAFGLGPLSDHIGRRKMIIAGMAGFALFTLLCGLANSFFWLILFRALSGIAAAAVAPQVWASIGDLIPIEKRGKAMGITVSALSVSQILGVPAAAFIAGIGNWHAPFFALAAFSTVVLFGALWIYPERENRQTMHNYSGLLSILRRVLTDTKTVAGLCTTFFFMLATFGFYTFLGAWLVHEFSLSVIQVGYIIILVGIGNFVGNLTGGFFIDRVGKKSMLITSLITLAIMLFVIPLTTFNMQLSLVCIFIWLVSGGISLTAINSTVSEMIPSLRGTVMSLNSSFMYLGTTLGSFLNGIILKHFDYFGIGCVDAISALVALGCFSLVLKLTKGVKSKTNTTIIT
jgi:MFS transporter, DHA1 family, inner membrane transport protein